MINKVNTLHCVQKLVITLCCKIEFIQWKNSYLILFYQINTVNLNNMAYPNDHHSFKSISHFVNCIYSICNKAHPISQFPNLICTSSRRCMVLSCAIC